ncbi:putative patatin/cPLA2 family phospholipase [Sinobacterium caligoides]|uniref:Putative patatin/cPLA2 family phospholipase n=1 Tax=Sinobacterium caligoides TaxID=933926 RepID=A0A3N2DP17_9GAMM|nr:patatin family protein [Sinobacterium caligoides]ROS01442.1 putative patatin/cPLA2 family phospholipase [Sinobacterium caligoides]
MSTIYRVNKNSITVKRPQRQLPRKLKIALVAEGGGQRGIFTAGVLDTFLKHNFTPFDTLAGTSAGAQNITSYYLRQHGYARRAIRELSTQKDFFKPTNLLRGENSLDLDWFFKHANADGYQLPLENLEHASAEELLIVASDKNTLETVCLNPSKDNIFEFLKASSSIPYLYQGVEYQGRHLVDGGLTAPIPLEEVLNQGANLVLIIRTVPSNKASESLWKQKAADSIREMLPENIGESFAMAVNDHLNLLPKVIKNKISKSKLSNPLHTFYDRHPQYKEMYALMKHHDKQYAETLRLIDTPPEDTVIVELSPVTALASHSLGSSFKSLDEDYRLGKQTAEFFLKNFRNFFIC